MCPSHHMFRRVSGGGGTKYNIIIQLSKSFLTGFLKRGREQSVNDMVGISIDLIIPERWWMIKITFFLWYYVCGLVFSVVLLWQTNGLKSLNPHPKAGTTTAAVAVIDINHYLLSSWHVCVERTRSCSGVHVLMTFRSITHVNEVGFSGEVGPMWPLNWGMLGFRLGAAQREETCCLSDL